MKILLLFCLSLVACASAPAPGHRPFEEMHGGCADYRIPLAQEFKDWSLGPTRLNTAKGKEGTLLPLGTRVTLELQPVASVGYVAPLDPRAPKEGYGAVAPLRVASSGRLKIAAGSKLWLELVTPEGKKVTEDGFEMQTHCESIYKVVTFPVKGGQDYLLEIAGSRQTEANLLISREQ